MRPRLLIPFAICAAAAACAAQRRAAAECRERPWLTSPYLRVYYGGTLKWGVEMYRRVVYYVWDETLQDYNERPLDDADPWTMTLANLVNGHNLSDEEFVRTIQLLDGVLTS